MFLSFLSRQQPDCLICKTDQQSDCTYFNNESLPDRTNKYLPPRGVRPLNAPWVPAPAPPPSSPPGALPPPVHLQRHFGPSPPFLPVSLAVFPLLFPFPFLGLASSPPSCSAASRRGPPDLLSSQKVRLLHKKEKAHAEQSDKFFLLTRACYESLSFSMSRPARPP